MSFFWCCVGVESASACIKRIGKDHVIVFEKGRKKIKFYHAQVVQLSRTQAEKTFNICQNAKHSSIYYSDVCDALLCLLENCIKTECATQLALIRLGLRQPKQATTLYTLRTAFCSLSRVHTFASTFSDFALFRTFCIIASVKSASILNRKKKK